MYLFHIAFSIGLIALTAGCTLYISAARHEGKGTGFAKFIAILVILVSLIGSICVAYCGYKAMRSDDQQCRMCLTHGMQMSGTATTMDTNTAATTNTKADTKRSHH